MIFPLFFFSPSRFRFLSNNFWGFCCEEDELSENWEYIYKGVKFELWATVSTNGLFELRKMSTISCFCCRFCNANFPGNHWSSWRYNVFFSRFLVCFCFEKMLFLERFRILSVLLNLTRNFFLCQSTQLIVFMRLWISHCLRDGFQLEETHAVWVGKECSVSMPT